MLMMMMMVMVMVVVVVVVMMMMIVIMMMTNKRWMADQESECYSQKLQCVGYIMCSKYGVGMRFRKQHRRLMK